MAEAEVGAAAAEAEVEAEASAGGSAGGEDEKLTEASVVAHLKERGIRLLAVDFDLTILDIHTRGRWGSTPEELALHVRPVFSRLISLALAEGLNVAVVTFSPQTDMVEATMREAFPDCADRIPVRGNDNAWQYEGAGSHSGKQPHMASAAEEINATCCEHITRSSTLLIDDDLNNIEIALAEQVKAVPLLPHHPERLLGDLKAV